MARYGVPYKGSKNSVARWVVGVLPPSHTLVDLFAGGCAVTHAAMLSGKWGRFIVNDTNDVPQVFADAIDGKFADYATVPTREEFDAAKGDDTVLSLLYSFGNDRRSYLWLRDVEQVKYHASRMLLAGGARERYAEYHKFVRALGAYVEANGTDCLRMDHLRRGNGVTECVNLQRLQRLHGLENLQRLQGLHGLQRVCVSVSRLDYRDVDVPDGATAYADPPYRNTSQEQYRQGAFDHVGFDSWLAEVPFPVFVSECTCPDGCVEVSRTQRRRHTAGNGNDGVVTERLFVQERFAEMAMLGGT